jgi:hypothetical protein
MKTISTILVIFIIGLLGWVGIERQEDKNVFHKKRGVEKTELRIQNAEKKCEELQCEIEDYHVQIEREMK